jgi:hypothetical protein
MMIGSPRHAVRRRLTEHPSLYLPLANWKRSGRALDHDTDLVLDGVTRTATTFAVIAFQLAQNDHVRVGHHLHAAAHITAAVERHVPTLVTVREPEAMVLSSLVREPRVTPRQWLKTYAAFYERILPFRDGFVVATFDQVTSDFGAVTRCVNERFGTRFREFEHTEPNVRLVFQLIDERVQPLPWSEALRQFISGYVSADEFWAASRPLRTNPETARPVVPKLRVQRPTDEREARKAELRARYRHPDLAGLRARAESAYRAVVEGP